MRKATYRNLLILAVILWTALVLYGSLASGDSLPSSGWLKGIPNLDKLVHFVFYAGETTLLVLLFDLWGWRKLFVWLPVVAGSALIEYLQGAYFGRSCDAWDLMANILGASFALWLSAYIRRLIDPVLK